MLKVYLAGPINGCTDEECRGWREEAKRRLEHLCDVIDPMDFDCRGLEGEKYREIIKNDLGRLNESDIVLVNATSPSWGTAMEIVYAGLAGKPVFAFCGHSVDSISPWLRGHCASVYETARQACDAIAGS